jgi:hypothetical protein
MLAIPHHLMDQAKLEIHQVQVEATILQKENKWFVIAYNGLR